MRNWGICIASLIIVGGFAVAQETAETNIVEVGMVIEETEGRPLPEFYFQPVGLFIEPGTTVRYIASSPHHNVVAYHEAHVKSHRVPDGVEPFSSPIVPVGETWEYTFTVPGVYDLWCGPHEAFGMAMRVVVGEASGPATEPPENFGPNGTFLTSGTVLSDPALNPLEIIARGQVMWQDLAPESIALQPIIPREGE